MNATVQVGLREKVVRSLCKAHLVPRTEFISASRLFGSRAINHKEFLITYSGSKYKGKIDNRTDWMIYYFGDADVCVTSFVTEIANFVRFKTGGPFSCYDIGASRGEFCLKIAGIVDRIVAFEQSIGRYSYLMENIGRAEVQNIEAFNMQVGDGHAVTSSAPDNLIEHHSEQPIEEQSIKRSSAQRIEADGADLFIESNGVDLPDLIRINTGDDYQSVINWLSPVLDKIQPIILIERSTPDGNNHECEAFLRSALHPDSKLYSLSGSLYKRGFRLGEFVPHARQIVCYPPKITRLIEQDFCKMKGLRFI